jgi:hypothetical protein
MHLRRGYQKTPINTEWSPELAYVVGLLTADGCLSPDGRHIDFTSKDRALVKTVRELLGLHRIKIGTKKGNYKTSTSYRIQFGSVHFYDWLLSVGLMPNKSKCISALNIPNTHFADFTRGLFDGDGTLYHYKDKRWKHSTALYLEISSASYSFVVWLQHTLCRLYGITGSVRDLGKDRVYLVRFAKAETLQFLEIMYTNPCSPRLARKFTKAQKVRMMEAGHKT